MECCTLLHIRYVFDTISHLITSNMSETSTSNNNRKARRTASKQSGQPVSAPTSTPHIKLAQPDRSGPKSKTLLALAEERRQQLIDGKLFDPFAQPDLTDAAILDEKGNLLDAGLTNGEDQPIGPVGQAVFWALVLSMMHFTLDVLVYHQYAQAVLWPSIFRRTGTMLPILFLLVWAMRADTAMKVPVVVRQVGFLVLSVGTGCYTIHAANRYDYFAVMKRTPPLGTLWVWSVIEMDLGFAVASVIQKSLSCGGKGIRCYRWRARGMHRPMGYGHLCPSLRVEDADGTESKLRRGIDRLAQ